MDPSFLLLVLFVLAVAIGWYLGRHSMHKQQQAETEESRPESVPRYLKGINYLMTDEPDKAVDIFLDVLDVNADTLETHITLGNLLRRKGEVDRAVRIHQNILSTTGLGEEVKHLAQLELARDYHSAGLLDRAENLLQEMVEMNSACRRECLLLLVEIYRDEKEWEKAIHAANLLRRRLLPLASSKDIDTLIAQSHFCCELAEAAFEQRDYLTARRWIKQAFGYDKSCVRASLIWGRLQIEKGRYRDAVKILKRIPQQNRKFIPEALNLLARCYQQLGDFKGYQKFLKQCLSETDSVSVMLQMADSIHQVEGYEAAVRFVGNELTRRPSIRGLSHFIEMHEPHTSGRARENLTLLKQLVDRLISIKPSYRCNNCGFSGKKLHWLCPSCKSWGSVNLIQGVEGE